MTETFTMTKSLVPEPEPFIHSSAETICPDCLTDLERARLGDVEVEVWETYSEGWVAPPICNRCRLAIPVYVNGDATPDEEDDGQ